MHYVSKHPLLKQKITVLRDESTNTRDFRFLASEITMLLAYEALKTVTLCDDTVKTPISEYHGKAIVNDIVFVPILRAGVGMLEGVLNLVPNAKVGFVGMYRDPDTKMPVTYYEKLPENLVEPIFFIIDPMLATGGSINATIDLLKEKGYLNIKLVSIISAPEGVKAVEDLHPDVQMYLGAVDEKLDERKYIVPGLGDAGDRLFGTK
jgi:uracil phosphoribosyltransferase